MSDYVRKKVVRFKIPQNIVENIENEIEKENSWDSIEELLIKKYDVKECGRTSVNEFVINDGYDSDNRKTHYFLDFMLDYEYGASGDFESVRLLTDKEFEKYTKKFAKYFNEIGRDELRLVHYSYYNGVDEPSVYEVEEI